MSRDEARTIALRRFGGVDQVKESVRDTWHVRLLGDVAQDLRYGLRACANRRSSRPSPR